LHPKAPLVSVKTIEGRNAVGKSGEFNDCRVLLAENYQALEDQFTQNSMIAGSPQGGRRTRG
jgi:hypothetical protein